MLKVRVSFRECFSFAKTLTWRDSEIIRGSVKMVLKWFIGHTQYGEVRIYHSDVLEDLLLDITSCTSNSSQRQHYGEIWKEDRIATVQTTISTELVLNRSGRLGSSRRVQ